jgi:hypothetical protein
MNRDQRSLSRTAALSLAVTFAVAACGGGSDSAPAESAPATDAPIDTALVEPATTLAPETTTTTTTTAAPATTTAPTTTMAPDPSAFCEEVETFYVAGHAIDFIDINDSEVFGPLYLLLAISATPTIDEAPTAEDAALFEQARELLLLTTPLADIDFDVSRGGELENGDEIGQALIDLDAVVQDVRTFSIDRCGSTEADLDARAMQTATDFSSDDTPPATTALPADSESSAGFVAIENDGADVLVNVPAGWTQTDGAPQGESSSLAAAPNLQAFLDGYSAPGVLLIAGDAPTPDSWTGALAATLEGAIEDGCSVAVSLDYDDGVYTGTEHILNCGTAATTPHLIGGRNEEGTRFFLLAVVRPADDENVRDEIVQSFFID